MNCAHKFLVDYTHGTHQCLLCGRYVEAVNR
jgi:hypothetical protein